MGWMIDGCAEWQSRGLVPPASVMAAAQDYFDSEDQIGHWLGECCSVGIDRRAPARALFASWSEWAKTNGFEPRTTRYLGEQLRARGLRPCKVGTDRGWLGLGLRRPHHEGDGA